MTADVMTASPLAVTAGTGCGELVERMTAEGATSALVTDADRRVLGILTDRDVARRICFRLPPETPVEQVMTAPVQTVRRGDYLYRAISLMRRQGRHHMPVVDRNERLIGMVDLDDAIGLAVARLMDQIDRLSVEGTIEGLRSVKSAQIQLADELFDDNVPATEIQQLVTDINNDIYRRIIRTSLAEMEADGWGPPPVKLDVLVMGSGGRGENYLFPDQDNGFILEDYPDSRHNEIDRFFIELADRMTRELNDVGFPYCRGNVMATNPIWRKSLSQWRMQTAAWGRKRNFIVARLVGIFFDFRAVYGTGTMTRSLREHVTHVMGESQGFLRELYRDEADHGTALGWFNRLMVEKNEEHRGQINLKMNGTLPLVEFIRLLALRDGIADTMTISRIEQLAEKGSLTRDQRDYLVSAFRHITGLLLHKQISDFRAGRKVTSYINPSSLSRFEREHLVEAFRSIENLRSKVRAEFTGDVF
jgi:signal-transduction protein with cAMP-binding, CBS, and nucleotidyltransferase domain